MSTPAVFKRLHHAWEFDNEITLTPEDLDALFDLVGTEIAEAAEGAEDAAQSPAPRSSSPSRGSPSRPGAAGGDG